MTRLGEWVFFTLACVTFTAGVWVGQLGTTEYVPPIITEYREIETFLECEEEPEEEVVEVREPIYIEPVPVATGTTSRVTAYCLQGTMANGEQVHSGAVACPRSIALGTTVNIGGTDYVCKDRTATHTDGTYDIWMGSCNNAIQWGVRYLEVTH